MNKEEIASLESQNWATIQTLSTKEMSYLLSYICGYFSKDENFQKTLADRLAIVAVRP